jgi:hypothetical protein
MLCLDRLQKAVYNESNFIECDEGEANYSSLQRTAGRCKAVRG